MAYQSLRKIYYTRSGEHAKAYAERFNSPLTRRFDFPIREYGRSRDFPAFFCYTEDFALLSEEISLKHEELLQALNAVPPLVLEQFVLACVVDEVRATSDIEGIHSTRREIKDVMRGAHSDRFSSLVRKYSALLGTGAINFKTCQDVRDFYDDFAQKEIAAANPTHKLDGVLFRRDSVDITSHTGKIIHRGVLPESRIIEMLDTALNVLNDAGIPLLARVAIFHYMFEYIHPFYDGNGRTARFIVSCFLSTRFNSLAALRLSCLIKKNRKAYYNLFAEADSEWNCGDLTPFVLGFTKIFAATFDDITAALNNKIAQLAKYQQKLLSEVGDDALTRRIYTALLQSSVFFGGGVNMRALMRLTGKARNTIKSRLAAMPASHLLTITAADGTIFYRLNLSILD